MILGKTVVITGAGKGIGFALTTALLKRGAASVLACDLHPEEAQASFAHPSLRWLKCDVTSDEDVQSLAASIKQADILFCNAGVNAMEGLFIDDGLAAAKREVDVNYLGALRVVRAVVPRLLSAPDGAALVFTGSVLADYPIAGFATYCVSKAALSKMAEVLRTELGEHGVHVLVAKPGAVDTDLIASLDIPKISAAEAATEILDALEARQFEVLVGPEAKLKALQPAR